MMIFLTIGTQEPFDRLVTAIDKLIPNLDGVEVLAQISYSNYTPQHMKAYEFLSPKQFDKFFSEADLIVSHAGMGTIISALVQKKSVLVMPRLLKYKEHRSDHQIATAKVFENLKYIEVANTEQELQDKILYLLNNLTKVKPFIGEYASGQLINNLKNEIQHK